MIKATILGCGTSGGVPRAPLQWGACDPNNPKNQRSRASLHINWDGLSIIIDTSPDLRQQALTNQIERIDAVLYTHDHADHCHGIDDLRGYFIAQGQPIPTYGDEATMDVISKRFDYVFQGAPGYPPVCTSNVIVPGTFDIAGRDIIAFEQQHGDIKSLGFRFGNIAYSTDLNALDDTAFQALSGVKVWIVDALRYKPHPTHPHLDQTLKWIEQVKPERAILTHMTWELDFETLKSELPEGVEPAFDGMSVTVD